MKEKFIDIYKTWITREGSSEFLKWLESTDFFDAPASTKYHLCKPGGLCTHSVNVFKRLEKLVRIERAVIEPDAIADCFIPILPSEDMESIAIIGLLHDICKVNLYQIEMRNRKNEQGQWEKYPFYVTNDKLPYGHGEKSVYIISGFMKLSREEAMAIRWHMGPWQDGEKNIAGRAFDEYPLALMAHFADMQATYWDEKED